MSEQEIAPGTIWRSRRFMRRSVRVSAVGIDGAGRGYVDCKDLEFPGDCDTRYFGAKFRNLFVKESV